MNEGVCACAYNPKISILAYFRARTQNRNNMRKRFCKICAFFLQNMRTDSSHMRVCMHVHVCMHTCICEKSAFLQVSLVRHWFMHVPVTPARMECCSVLQCIAVCCSVLQCAAVCCNELQCVAECCRVLQSVAECCRVLQCVAVCCRELQSIAVCCSVLP